jgi:hypothetical protein
MHSSPVINPQSNSFSETHKRLLETLKDANTASSFSETHKRILDKLTDANTASHCSPLPKHAQAICSDASIVLPPPTSSELSFIPKPHSLSTASVSLPWLSGRDSSASQRVLSSPPPSPILARTSLRHSSCVSTAGPASPAYTGLGDVPAAAVAAAPASQQPTASQTAAVENGEELSRYIAAFVELTRQVWPARRAFVRAWRMGRGRLRPSLPIHCGCVGNGCVGRGACEALTRGGGGGRTRPCGIGSPTPRRASASGKRCLPPLLASTLHQLPSPLQTPPPILADLFPPGSPPSPPPPPPAA